MQNIFDLQDFLKDFFNKELKKFYNFDLWSKVHACNGDSSEKENIQKQFDRFGTSLTPVMIDVNVKASPDPWAPCCHIEYEWKCQNNVIGVVMLLVKDEIFWLKVNDMKFVYSTFGGQFDFKDEFIKTVVLVNALRG